MSSTIAPEVTIPSDAPAAVDRPTKSIGHIAALDGLRGIAILGVLLFHFAPYLESSNVVFATYTNLRASCWAGVDLFFVLSGFLITGILLDSKNRPNYFRNFLARRSLRIFPLYFGLLALATLLLPADLPPTAAAEPTVVTQNPWWIWLYATNFAVSLNQSWHFNLHQLNVSHFWSLAVEEHFYLLWPAVVWFCRPKQLTWVCGTLIVGALMCRLALCATQPPIALYVLTPCRMDALAMGSLLALAARRPGGLQTLAPASVKVALAAGGLMFVLFALGGGEILGVDYSPVRYFTTTFGYTLLSSTSAAIVVLAITSQGLIKKFCSSRILRFFGAYSYGIYVFHGALSHWYIELVNYAHEHWWGASTAVRVGDMFAKCAASVLIAVLSYHLYEKHFLKLKRYFESKPARTNT